jgi:hypothetical protein
MPDHPIFEISPDQVAAIDDEGLRLLIARLCEADLRRRGHPTSAALYGGNHRAATGGVDVRVELAPGTAVGGFVPRSTTVYQSKAEDMTPSKIAKEMRSTAKQAKGRKTHVLRPVIRELAETGGAPEAPM